jgi:O-antigen ligase
MKWTAIIILLVATVPASAWLRHNSWVTSKALILMGFLPFAMQAFHLYMAAVSLTDWPLSALPISWKEFPASALAISEMAWPGYVKGLEISVLDVLALALYLSLPGARHPLPFRVSMALYFVAASLSTLQAAEPLAALFYLWQLARMFLVYAVVARACTDPRGVLAILMGMAAGLFMEAGVDIWQRFGGGLIQTSGTLAHQNLLGMMSHFVVYPFLALLLAGPRIRLPALVALAGITVDVLTASRATLAIGAFGYAAVFMLSALRRWTSRKALLLLIGALTLMVVAPLALRSLDSRFAAQQTFDLYYDERAAFKRAAAMILSDHPWGVGVNHYVLAANNGGYNRWAQVVPVPNSLLTNVHNVYWLVAAESGYLGIITFLLLLLRPLIVAFVCGWRNRKDQRGDLLIGIGVALLAVYIHSLWEWIFIDFEAQYMFALTVGLVAALAEQLGYWRHRDLQIPFRVSTLPIRPGNTRGLSRRVTHSL